MIKPGEEWGTPSDAVPEIEVEGDDAALAAFVQPDRTATLVRFVPQRSELARCIGLADSGAGDGPRARARGIALPIDALTTSIGAAVNAVVIGVVPTRLRRYHRRHPLRVTVDGREVFTGTATTVVIANGQFIDGVDVVPRGHPGDGRVEVQVYALDPQERRGMRRRLPAGGHLPHPRILATTGKNVHFDGIGASWAVTVDGQPRDPVVQLDASVIPRALTLLI